LFELADPPLVGDDFLGGWKGKSVGDLFDEVRMTMPFDSPLVERISEPSDRTRCQATPMPPRTAC